MKEKDLIQQAKIQGFSQVLSKGTIECSSMSFQKQIFIQEIAEFALDRMVSNDISYDNDVKKCEYINKVLTYILKDDISKEELDEIFNLTFDTLNNLIKYLLKNFEED